MSAFQTQKCRLSPEHVKNGNFHSDNLRWCLRFCVSSSQVMLMFMVHAKNWVKGLYFKSNNNLPLIIIVIILYKSYLKRIMVNMKINNLAHKKTKFIESCQYRTSCSNSIPILNFCSCSVGHLPSIDVSLVGSVSVDLWRIFRLA